MKILIILDKYLPDGCGGAPIFADMCRDLADRGFDVTVRCPYPYYPEWKDKSGRNGLRVERTVEDGVKVERYGMYIPNDPRSIRQRLLLDAIYFLSLSRSLFGRNGFDAVMVSCPLIGGVAFAGLYTWLARRPLWLNVLDIPADAALVGGISRVGPMQMVLQRVQKALFNRADVWSSISPVMIERLEMLRSRSQPIVFLPNWPHLTISDEIRRLPSKVGRPVGRPVQLLYSGNIGNKQGLLEFCKTLRASSADFDLKIRGDGGVAREVREWVSQCGDARFSMAPLVDEAGFVRGLHEADLFLVTEKSGGGASFFPSKTVPGMASGTPILAISDPGSSLGREMRDHGLGPWFPWDRADQVGPMLAELGDRPEEFATWQRNSIRRAQDFDRGRCLDLVSQVFLNLAAEVFPTRLQDGAVASPAEAIV
jgi:colanic acid biosynthesis glycosyl transferase WcaI